MEQRKETYSMAAGTLNKLGLADQAAIYSNKVKQLITEQLWDFLKKFLVMWQMSSRRA